MTTLPFAKGRGAITLGDCRDLLDSMHTSATLLTDPPYGIGYAINARKEAPAAKLKSTPSTSTAAATAILGDDEPFDPTPWVAFPRCAFFGAQHFSDKLPLGRWLVWDKRVGGAPDDHSDGDLVWLSGSHTRALRIHQQKWRGVIRAGEENCSRSRKLHPNQKPVALLTRILTELSPPPDSLVIDPYMGSGSTGVSALRQGFCFLGVEIDSAYFKVAAHRLIAEFGE